MTIVGEKGDKKVLIVDDEPANIEFLEEILEMQGCKNVDSFISANEAIESYKATNYDLVLLDWNMPELSGLEVLKTFIDINKDPKPKVVVLTGHKDITINEQALAHGANDILSKPFSINSLVDCLDKAFSNNT